MAEETQPNVGVDLIRIHKAITRGLDVSINTAQKYLALTDLPPEIERGFPDYVQCLVTMLEGHHLMEDEMAFPYFQSKSIFAPYKMLDEQHHQITICLTQVRGVLNDLRNRVNVAATLQKVAEELSNVRLVWKPHIAQEEVSFSPDELAGVLSLDEHNKMSQQLGKFAQEHSNPPELVLPFVLYNLPPDERAKMAQNMPPMVTQQLIPGPWKQQWVTMQPFLLE